uniref:Lupus la protein n=1 Tax=Tanacetum cinerariifolium TaxID=118510 RepID=A0A6L2LT15_TANCI|nr:lupus la protein [Tanacetum cinerariifolium]
MVGNASANACIDAFLRIKYPGADEGKSDVRNGVSFTIAACTSLHDAGLSIQLDATHAVDGMFLSAAKNGNSSAGATHQLSSGNISSLAVAKYTSSGNSFALTVKNAQKKKRHDSEKISSVQVDSLSVGDKESKQSSEHHDDTPNKEDDMDIGPYYDIKPMVEVPYTTEYNVFAIETQHTEQSKNMNDTSLMEKVDSNTTPDSSDMCNNEIEADQYADDHEDERVMLVNLVANL